MQILTTQDARQVSGGTNTPEADADVHNKPITSNPTAQSNASLALNILLPIAATAFAAWAVWDTFFRK